MERNSLTQNNTNMKTRITALVIAIAASAAIQVSAKQFWPVIMDGTTLEANASSMVASFAPNDVDQFLYPWENTYVAGASIGLNFNSKITCFTH